MCGLRLGDIEQEVTADFKIFQKTKRGSENYDDTKFTSVYHSKS